MAKQTIWAPSADFRLVSDFLTSDKSGSSLNQDRWSEHFQDLSGYCNTGLTMTHNSSQPLGEQLNTPNITVQEEFNFGLRSSTAGEFIRFDDSDPWQVSEQPTNSTQQQTGLWNTVQDWLSTSSQKGIDEQEVIDLIDVDEIDVDEGQQLDIFEKKPAVPLVRPDGDYLLSQSPASYKQASLQPQPVHELNHEQSYNDLVSLFNTNQSTGKSLSLMQHQHSTDECLNSNTVNMNNNVLSSNSNKYQLKLNQQETCDLFINNPTTTLKFKPKTLENEMNNFENRRIGDPVDRSVNLISIFKSEEPFIGDTVNDSPSLLCTRDNDDVTEMTTNDTPVRLVPAVITPRRMANAMSICDTSARSLIATDIVNQSNICNEYSDRYHVLADESASLRYILPKVKEEPSEVAADIEVEAINSGGRGPAVLEAQPVGGKKVFKIPPMGARKTGLKLDIDSATRFVSSVVTPTLTPTTSSSIVADANVSLSTPDVLRPLLTGNKEFNLLSYIVEDGNEELNSKGSNSSTNSSKRSSVSVASKQPPASSKSVQRRKRQRVSKCNDNTDQLAALTVIKEERCSEDDNTLEDDQVSPARRTTSKRRRVAKRSDDMEFDIDNISDCAEEEEDDERNDKTFYLSPYRRKRTLSSTSRSSAASGSSKWKQSKDTDSSDHESISSNMDRYRELRNRNNEASRRSRLNRKSREQDMKWHANKLEQDNKRLRAKADEMERLVKKLREGLMQLVLKKR